MTKKESDILIEVATDMKWIKRQQEENSAWLQKSFNKIEEHLGELNDHVASNTIDIAVNKRSIIWMWSLITIIIIAMIGIAIKVIVF